MKISFIGGGNMGEAMLSAILGKGLSTTEDIIVSDVSDQRRQHLEQQYSITVTGNNLLAAERGKVVVLAIKPQNLADVLAELKGHLKPTQLVLSIVAGARISTLCDGLDYNCVVRSMPNTPALIGEGISVWTATSGVTEQQKRWAGSILWSMGREIYVDDENYVDMATAISGSGPAYIFLFIESLVDAAINIGLPLDMAEPLVLHTLLGSGHFLQKSGRPPAELRRIVTSPGGTTAAALKVFEEGGFSELIKQAVRAAYNRAIELGK